MTHKIRLDVALMQQGLASSREKAKAMIMAGDVLVDGERQNKAGDLIAVDTIIRVKSQGIGFVSRGGLKLDKAITQFKIQLSEKICMDVGASTGGFTDCMLKNGAQKVYAIDVGYGQLAWSLRTDDRVISLERTNIRHLTIEQVPERVHFASVDVSFISLALVLPVVYEFLHSDGHVVCLIKPQFEAGREKVGKKGVIRDLAIHQEVCQQIYFLCKKIGFCVIATTYSPIQGPQGNIEFLFYLQKNKMLDSLDREQLDEMIEQAHRDFKR